MDNFKVHKINLKNFRNFKNLDAIDLSQGINCIYGPNGKGKTNLLEAIHILFNKKSFRKNVDYNHIISYDGEETDIIVSSLLIGKDNEKSSYSLKINQDNYFYSLNGKETNKKIQTSTILINPFDFYLFFRDASFRRKWFDNNFSTLSLNYKRFLKDYNNLLRKRNYLLAHKPNLFEKQINALDDLLIPLNKKILEQRMVFIDEMNSQIKDIYRNLFEEKFDLSIFYQSSFSRNPTIEEIYETFKKHSVRDQQVGFTTKGIHRDDYTLQNNGFNSENYSSLGQQKVAYLSLLFAYIEQFRYKMLSQPILLVDDVSGELDRNRWHRLMEYFGAGSYQVFITSANENFMQEINDPEDVRMISIK